MRNPGTKPAASGNLLPQSALWLAALVFLAQLPHYLHLPWWVNLFGATVIVVRVLNFTSSSTNKFGLSHYLLNSTVLAVIAACAAVAVRIHYGYFLGRDPCVAFLFLLVSFKFAESRNGKDATLLICLSGFLLLTQYFYAQSILSALVSLPAVLTTGACLIRLSSESPSISPGGALKLTAKLLIQGAPIAAILFLLFPRLPGPLWNLPTDSVAKTGLSDSMAPGSISSLSQSSAVAFRVDFEGDPPPPEQRYWRGPVLSLFDGRQWSDDPKPTNSVSMAPVNENTIAYTVTLEPHNRHRLFALDIPASLPIGSGSSPDFHLPLARLTGDLQLLTHKPVVKAIRYKQLSTPGRYYTEHNAALISNTQLAGINVDAEKLAKSFRKNNNSNSDIARAVMNWISTENFHYTLQPDLLGSRPVDEFLLSTRRGFCEHYASAFVVLMRAASIPARVVTGYLGGEMNGDYMIVRQSDAHAWTEVWLNHRWVRFDPTAAVAPERVESLSAAMPDNSSIPGNTLGNSGWMKRLHLGLDAINHSWQRSIIDFNNQSQNRFWKKLGFQTPEPWQVVSVLIAFGTLWCLIVLRLGQPRRTLSAEERLWVRYCRRLERAGLAKNPAEGPLDYLQRCKTRWPEHAGLFTKLTVCLNNLRFGNPDVQQRTELLAECGHIIKQLPPSFRLQKTPPTLIAQG